VREENILDEGKYEWYMNLNIEIINLDLTDLIKPRVKNANLIMRMKN
jgi:hypothetical protein